MPTGHNAPVAAWRPGLRGPILNPEARVSRLTHRLKLDHGLAPRLLGASVAVGGLSLLLSLLGAAV